MARPSPQMIAWVRANAAALEPTATDAEVAAALNARTIPNPAPRALVAPRLDVNRVRDLIGPASRAKLIGLPALVAFRDDLAAGRLEQARSWLIEARDAELITVSEYNAVMAAAMTPIPDPAWSAAVPEAVAVLGRPVDPADVAAAREV